MRRRGSSGSAPQSWWRADEGQVHARVIDYVSAVESQQSAVFDRMEKLACLYDPIDPGESRGGPEGQMTENVIASNVDTVTAVVTKTEVRPRVLTDDAEWSVQRTARKLETYAELLKKKLRVHEVSVRSFFHMALKGTGLNKVYVDPWKRIRVEAVRPDDIVVDEGECAGGGEPRQMHHRILVDKDQLKARFPEHADEIERAVRHGGTRERYWAGYRPYGDNEIVCIESWYLPIGARGQDGYQAGRHAVVIDGFDLLDEEYHRPFFPFAVAHWTRKTAGWYGISGAYRIAGHQRSLNKQNWQIDRNLDQIAVPTRFVRPVDSNLAVKSANAAGATVVVRGEMPTTQIPPAVSPEYYNRREATLGSAFQEFGQSRMATSAMKPAGIDSAVGLREYKDQTTDRFALQERAFERDLVLRTIWLVLYECKELGDDAPVVIHRGRFGPEEIQWSKVDMGDVEVQLDVANELARTPAGRLQLALEWAQAGVISQDEARRLMRHPDTERAMSLYTAALEDLEATIEEILDGSYLVPEPYQDLKMGVWRMERAYLNAKWDGAPENILEGLRQWMVIASSMLAQSEAALPASMGAPAMGAPPMPGAPMTPAPGVAGPMGDVGPMMTGAGVTPLAFAGP